MATAHPAVHGRWAEQRAWRLLQARGWRLVARNWRCRWGELDLIVHKPGRLLLVEVKGRSSTGRDGAGRAALGYGKQRRLRRAALCWLAAHPHHQDDQMALVAALVGLPPRMRAVQWLNLSGWR